MAICKPRIRSVAVEGDYVIGFAGNDIDPENGLIHVARITARELDGAYYAPDSEFRGRADSIYERTRESYVLRPNPFHGLTEMDRDLGAQRGRANVLLSIDFRYYGANRISVERRVFPKLRARIDRLSVHHRVNHAPEVREELRALVERAFAASPTKLCGRPTHATGSPCNTDDDVEECSC